MSNCRNCGAAANIYNDGCDYCGTNVPIKRHVSRVDLDNMPRGKAEKLLEDFWFPAKSSSIEFNPDEWTHSFDAARFLRLTRCGHNVDMVKDFIEIYGEDAPIKWKESTGTDWPKRVKQ